jgi:RNA polymerase sigma-70 factor (ECF subfamily)
MRNVERVAQGRELTDRDLWRLASDGDRDSFGALFERHARAIYNFCFRCTGQWAAAEDLVSATFLHAWRRRGEVRFSGSSVLPFLYGVAANLIRNHERGARRGRAALARLAATSAAVPDPADDVAGRLDDQRRMREVLRRTAALTTEERDVFTLCIWQGLSYEEASTALGIPTGTVRSRLSRARARLRAHSPDQGAGPPPGTNGAIDAEPDRRRTRDA